MGRTRMNLAVLAAVTLYLVSSVSSQEHPYSLSVSQRDFTVLVDKTEAFDLLLNGILDQDISITFVKQHDELIDLQPPVVNFDANNPANATITVLGKKPGHLEVTATAQPNETWIIQDIYLRIKVANSIAIVYVSSVFGWVYFAAWSISFYPQIYYNFRRKSVVGLNFDFLALNIVGFLLYSIFNIGLFWIPEIQNEYFERHPRGLNPVLINDVVFALHAMFATIITIIQCFIYERAEQRVSMIARSIIGIFFVVVVVSAGLAGGAVIHWLDFLYYCSYVKLSITLIKYIPQAIMNYRRKSTVGWSIGNILLDFIGGTLSMLQMILNAYNFDDWVSIFGDPTKFGLGLFSVLFDIFFMLQHYVFYRSPNQDRHSTYNEFDALSDSITRIVTHYPRTEIFIAGDFNIHNSSWLRHSGQTTPEGRNLQPYEFIPGDIVNQRINSNQRRPGENDQPFRVRDEA